MKNLTEHFQVTSFGYWMILWRITFTCWRKKPHVSTLLRNNFPMKINTAICFTCTKYFLVLMRMFWRPSFHALLSSSLRIVEIQNLSFPEVNFQEIIKESPISSLFKIAAKAKSGSEIYTYHHVYLKFRKYIRKVFTCNCFSWNTEHPLW